MGVGMDKCVLMGIVRGNRAKAFSPHCDGRALIKQRRDMAGSAQWPQMIRGECKGGSSGTVRR